MACFSINFVPTKYSGFTTPSRLLPTQIMDSQVNFIFKVLIFSAGISLLIKYGGPSLPIAATSANALIAVLIPSVILAIALLWRAGKYRQPD
ncbi:MAG: hypothetical protein AB1589_00535 [Cyanobacteriota bacterium]